MSWNGSEQLVKAMEEVLNDDDEVKVEKSSVEKMEKQGDAESRVLEPQPSGTPSESFKIIYKHTILYTVHRT